MREKKVLLVEGNSGHGSNIREILRRSGTDLAIAGDGRSAFERLTGEYFDLVITEIEAPVMNGLNLLRKIKEVKESLPVVVVSGKPSVKEAVEAIKMGACDYLLTPVSEEIIKSTVSQLTNNSLSKDKQDRKDKFTIITRDASMEGLLQEAREVADSRASVFIQGESGTGKELFARFIHRHSNRRTGAFVAINCSALPETLLESELFGHEKGSFTGAISRKRGKFEIADHGTLLLDEISEMDIQLQSKLLRVLQEREIERVGGVSPIPIDVRIIATTNRDIEKQIDEGRFREDLYYRLNVIPIRLPPLRERKDDIPLMVDYFIKKYNSVDHRSVKGLTDDALQCLMQMPWKGNVRELENIIERAILRCRGELITRDDFSPNGKRSASPDITPDFTFNMSLKEVEEKVIFNALDRTKGNRTHAAEVLGISVRTLRNKLNEYRKKM